MRGNWFIQSAPARLELGEYILTKEEGHFSHLQSQLTSNKWCTHPKVQLQNAREADQLPTRTVKQKPAGKLASHAHTHAPADQQMKLFAFVRRAHRPPPTAPDDDRATATATAAATTEKRRRRLSSSSSSGSAWKPTLGAISEDAAMTSAPVAQAKAAAAPARAKARSPRRATRAAGYDDFR